MKYEKEYYNWQKGVGAFSEALVFLSLEYKNRLGIKIIEIVRTDAEKKT